MLKLSIGSEHDVDDEVADHDDPRPPGRSTRQSWPKTWHRADGSPTDSRYAWPPAQVSAIALPAVAVATYRIVRNSEIAHPIPFGEIALLRRLPLFALVPPLAIEAAARAITPVRTPAGEPIITEGEIGNRFYAIVAGQVQVSQGDRAIGRLGPGDSFGELALIRQIPRTASVVALTDVELRALDRAAFLLAVTASPGAADEAARIAGAHLEHDRLAAPAAEQP